MSAAVGALAAAVAMGSMASSLGGIGPSCPCSSVLFAHIGRIGGLSLLVLSPAAKMSSEERSSSQEGVEVWKGG